MSGYCRAKNCNPGCIKAKHGEADRCSQAGVPLLSSLLALCHSGCTGEGGYVGVRVSKVCGCLGSIGLRVRGVSLLQGCVYERVALVV